MKDISVIFSTWNNAQQLRITCEAMAACAIPEGVTWELVIVNNNCTDNTDQVVEEFKAKLPIQYLSEPQQGLSRARNRGIEASQGSLLIFTDDDVRPCREWISIFWKYHQKHQAGYYFGGSIESEFENKNYDPAVVALGPPSVRGLNWPGTEARPLKKGEYFISANWACRREVIVACGGFDVTRGLNSQKGRVSVGEEVDLMNRIRHKGLIPLYLPTATLKHFVPASKSEMKHILKREKAASFERAKDQSRQYTGRFLFDIPAWKYKVALKFYVNWIKQKILGKKGYREYLEFQRYVGKMQGIRAGRTAKRESRAAA